MTRIDKAFIILHSSASIDSPPPQSILRYSMFESRLRLFRRLILLMAGMGARAFELQVKHHDHWQKQVADRGLENTTVEPPRGRILDIRGRELAVDKACIDACVDYGAIVAEPDDKWYASRLWHVSRADSPTSTAPLPPPSSRR